MKKKILSMVLAGMLIFSAGSVSQAAEQTISKTEGLYQTGELKIDGEFVTPTIKVDLSQTAATRIAINPYGLEAAIPGTVSGSPEQREQLVNKVETIENKSKVALAVNATVSATTEGKAKLATAAVSSAEKTNSIFAYLQMELGDAVDATKEFNAKGTDQVVFAAKATTKKGMVTLKDKNAADSKKAAYKILGSVAPNPTVVWEAADIAKFTIIFDFEPRVLPD